MTKQSHILDFAQHYAATVKSDILRQRILQDAVRKPREALQDAVTILNLLEPIHTYICDGSVPSVLSQRLLQDLSRLDFEGSLDDIRAQIDFLTKAVNIDADRVCHCKGESSDAC